MVQLWSASSIIVCSIMLGYICQLLLFSRYPNQADKLIFKSATIQKLVMVTIIPITLTLTIWDLSISFDILFFIPVLGILSHVIGGFAAIVASTLMRHNYKQKGAMLTCGAFTNLGLLGGLVTYIFYGETGYALAAFFRLFEPMIYFGAVFPLVKRFSNEPLQLNRGRVPIKVWFDDVLIIISLSSIILGLLLNWSGWNRPPYMDALTSSLILGSTAILLFAMGLILRLSAIVKNLREAFIIVGIKHMLVPLILAIMALALGYGSLYNGLPLKVIITMSAMPVAFIAIVPSTLYDLDINLTNACWLFSTLVFTIIIVPLLYLVKLM